MQIIIIGKSKTIHYERSLTLGGAKKITLIVFKNEVILPLGLDVDLLGKVYKKIHKCFT